MFLGFIPFDIALVLLLVILVPLGYCSVKYFPKIIYNTKKMGTEDTYASDASILPIKEYVPKDPISSKYVKKLILSKSKGITYIALEYAKSIQSIEAELIVYKNKKPINIYKISETVNKHQASGLIKVIDAVDGVSINVIKVNKNTVNKSRVKNIDMLQYSFAACLMIFFISIAFICAVGNTGGIFPFLFLSTTKGITAFSVIGILNSLLVYIAASLIMYLSYRLKLKNKRVKKSTIRNIDEELGYDEDIEEDDSELI